MNDFKTIRNKYYNIVRYIATFIIGPLLIYKGYYYKDELLMIIGIMLIIWDGLKIYYDS